MEHKLLKMHIAKLLSEEAQEARNKDIKRFRENNTIERHLENILWKICLIIYLFYRIHLFRAQEK